jgi:hypothetical protein
MRLVVARISYEGNVCKQNSKFPTFYAVYSRLIFFYEKNALYLNRHASGAFLSFFTIFAK